MSLLEVQSEQLAIKLQQEADKDTTTSHTNGAGAPGDLTAAAALDGPPPAAAVPDFSAMQVGCFSFLVGDRYAVLHGSNNCVFLVLYQVPFFVR